MHTVLSFPTVCPPEAFFLFFFLTFPCCACCLVHNTLKCQIDSRSPFSSRSRQTISMCVKSEKTSIPSASVYVAVWIFCCSLGWPPTFGRTAAGFVWSSAIVACRTLVCPRAVFVAWCDAARPCLQETQVEVSVQSSLLCVVSFRSNRGGVEDNEDHTWRLQEFARRVSLVFFVKTCLPIFFLFL